MRLSLARLLTLVLVIATAVVLVRFAAPTPESDPVRMTWIATASQFGPVGYRDPVGAISPDGRFIAYSEGRFARVRSLEGGPIVDLPAGDGQIRYMTWHPDSRTLLTDGDATGTGWSLYDHVSRTRRPLFDGGDKLVTPSTSLGASSSTALKAGGWDVTSGQHCRAEVWGRRRSRSPT